MGACLSADRTAAGHIETRYRKYFATVILISEGASNVRKGVEIFGQSNQQYWDALDALKKGQKFPEPILISRNPNSDLVVIDGHLRLTVNLLDSEYTPNEIEVVLGYSENFQNWDLY